MKKLTILQQFFLVALASLLVIGAVFGRFTSETLKKNQLLRAHRLTAWIVSREIQKDLGSTVLHALRKDPDDETFAAKLPHLNFGPNINAIKIWYKDASVIWSSDRSLIGKTFPDNSALAQAISGEVATVIKDSEELRKKYHHISSNASIAEIYTPIRFSDNDEIEFVVEAYQDTSVLFADIARNQRAVWETTIYGLLTLFLVLFWVFHRAERQINRQQAALIDSEGRYRSLVQSAHDAIISFDDKGSILLFNNAAEKIFAIGKAETAGMKIEELIVESDRRHFNNFAGKHRIGAGAVSMELRGVRRNNKTFAMEISLSSADNSRREQFTTAIIRDISQRQQMLEQILRAKIEWEETFDTINDAITIHDSNFNIIRANRAAEQLLGHSMEEILSRKCHDSYHGTPCPPDECPSCQTLKTGKLSMVETFEPHLNLHLEIKALPRLDSRGHIFGVIHIVRDISERKEAEKKHKILQQQFQQAQKMESVGRLAGGVAHDFNNMLTTIIGFSELVLDVLPRDHEVYDDITQILKAGQKAGDLTRHLLAFSRKQVLETKPVNLSDLVSNMTKMLTRLINEDISLELKLDPKGPYVMADPGQLEQILLNLAVNARDAMPDGGRVLIETGTENIDVKRGPAHREIDPGDYAVLRVRDNGSGIPDEIRDSIFEPFFTTKEMGQGTGLGLATVYGIVKQHNGSIFVESALEQGTTFTIYLPAMPADTIIGEEKTERAAMPRGTETVLVVDDESAILRLTESVLKGLGYTVLQAGDGIEALEKSRAHDGEIDLLLSDVIMPRMNGRRLADSLLAERPGLRVLFMSGYTEDIIDRHGVLEDRTFFINKPLTPAKLAFKVRETLDTDVPPPMRPSAP